jgi:hypothetical protein
MGTLKKYCYIYFPKIKLFLCDNYALLLRIIVCSKTGIDKLPQYFDGSKCYLNIELLEIVNCLEFWQYLTIKLSTGTQCNFIKQTAKCSIFHELFNQMITIVRA